MPYSPAPSTVSKLTDEDCAVVDQQSIMLVSKLRQNISNFLVKGEPLVCEFYVLQSDVLNGHPTLQSRSGCTNWCYHFTMETVDPSSMSNTQAHNPNDERCTHLPADPRLGRPLSTVDPVPGSHQSPVVTPSFTAPWVRQDSLASPASTSASANAHVAFTQWPQVAPSYESDPISPPSMNHASAVVHQPPPADAGPDTTFVSHFPLADPASVLCDTNMAITPDTTMECPSFDQPPVDGVCDSNPWFYDLSWEQKFSAAHQQSVELSDFFSSLFGLDIYMQAFARMGEGQECVAVNLPGFSLDATRRELEHECHEHHLSNPSSHVAYPGLRDLSAWP
ncbi:hypothetical protein BKA70DRAFT_1440895 [Coprinopsis sp. MPI-PUGE-AT-0042]|nr:hypothetical protein BKA70DRAFT_1440895 [Coprinopsis sp. MPI-PUGE-AT-0042]